MRKNIVIGGVALAILAVLAIGTTFCGWVEKVNNAVKNEPAIGTQVGPGEGPIIFQIGRGETRVEALATTTKMPQVGESLVAKTISGQEILGEVVWVGCIYKNKAIATILSERGLITVGVIF
jgi:hypothetical protein